jgi:4-hydroxybenzoate polyprenyltransferase/phosphoserine phosphatase
LDQEKDVPLCVDLDGTLIRSDALIESVLLLIKTQPWAIFFIPFWLLRGRAVFKGEVAKRVTLNANTLPYQTDLFNFLKQQHAAGRILVLATASHTKIAHHISDHLGIFTQVLATADVNLSGRAKRDRLVERFGRNGFDYAGNSRADLHVWEVARETIVVNAGTGLLGQASAKYNVSHVFADKGPRISTYAKALRTHQWIKNILVFVPMLGSHQLTNPYVWAASLVAFACFCLCASSVYLLNDLLDLPSDREHPRKRRRPFAAGDLPLTHGLVLIPILLIAAFGIAALFLPTLFLAALAIYYFVTLGYSLGLKAIVLLDALMLSGLYTMRIIGGIAATRIPPTFWLLVFSIFLFFSLALVKRYSELLTLKQRGQLTAHGRGYQVDDLVVLLAFGITSGFLAVLVSAFYINSPNIESLYRYPELLWPIGPLLLYWVSRIWLIAHRGGMHDDPIVFAATDRGSWIIALIIGGLAWLAAK